MHGQTDDAGWSEDVCASRGALGLLSSTRRYASFRQESASQFIGNACECEEIRRNQSVVEAVSANDGKQSVPEKLVVAFYGLHRHARGHLLEQDRLLGLCRVIRPVVFAEVMRERDQALAGLVDVPPWKVAWLGVESRNRELEGCEFVGNTTEETFVAFLHCGLSLLVHECLSVPSR